MQFVKETLQNCELLESVNTITWCITAQQDLANTLRAKQNLSQNAIFSWAEFLTHVWKNQKVDSRLILSHFQTTLIWESIIKVANDYSVLDYETTISFAQQAWQYLHEWNLSLDNGVFIKWASQFQAKLDTFKSITLDQVPNFLPALLRGYYWPKKMIFLGFMQFSLSQKNLVDFLRQCGVDIQFGDKSPAPIHAQWMESFSETKQQYQAMANWAREVFNKSDSKNIKIGCVVPNLSNKYKQVESIFTDIKIPFALACDKKLHTTPLIFHGLQFLKLLLNTELYYQDLTQFLLSPFLAGSTVELSSRALLDLALRKQGGTHFTLHDVLALAKNSSCKYFSPILSDGIDKLLEINKKLFLKMSLKQWSVVFEKALAVLGWPGEQGLFLDETWVVQQWQLLLHDFQQLDFLVGELDLPRALQLINRMAKKFYFKPRISDQPVQIIDLLEAYGQEFDYLWIADTNENVFVSKINPFIRLPFDQAQIYKQFLNAIAQKVKNPLLSCVQKETVEITNTRLQSLVQKTLEKEPLEKIEDNYAPLVNANELRGAVQKFKLQAICPFKAVAQQRFHAQKIPRPTLGLDPIDRGIMVHHLMENIWRFLKDSETLKKLSDENLKNIVDVQIEKSLLYFIAQKPKIFQTRFTSLEKQRLKKLVMNWLQYEKNRFPFKVLSLETEKKIQLDDFNFTIRIDRIDQLENGNLVIIDYKTSVLALKDCFGERLTEPQLPIYYLFSNDASIDALAFAQITPKEMKFKGIAAEDELLPHVKKNYVLKYVNNWSELKKFWQANLLRTANQIIQGYAVADPIDGKNTCQFCEFKILCRKNLSICQDETDENQDE